MIDDDTRLTRRRLLMAFATVAVGVVVPGGGLAVSTSSRFQGAAALPGLFSEAGSARALGHAYIRATPSEADERVLVEAIAQGFPGGLRALQHTPERKLRPLLAARIRADFGAGATVLLDRWLLSLTEVRLCALAALA